MNLNTSPQLCKTNLSRNWNQGDCVIFEKLFFTNPQNLYAFATDRQCSHEKIALLSNEYLKENNLKIKLMKPIQILSLIFLLFSCNKPDDKEVSWSLILEQPDGGETEVVKLPSEITKPFNYNGQIGDIQISFSVVPNGPYSVFKATAVSATGTHNCFFSLKRKYETQKPFMFNGPVERTEIYRQSPHDPSAWIVTKIAEQGMPMVALKDSGSFTVALSGSPALYNNFTSQSFNLEEKFVKISSGDNGQTPGLKPDIYDINEPTFDNGQSPDTARNKQVKKEIVPRGLVKAFYHEITKNKPHTFEGVLFVANANDLVGLRQKANQYAAYHFSNGKYNDAFGTLAYSTAYMNLRVNETGKSDFWVVPSIEYANTQYCRDAFWIATMLSPEFDNQCLKNELEVLNTYAEYPLFVVIWAYRSFKNGYEIDLPKVQVYMDAIEKKSKNGRYYPYDPGRGTHDFQYWADLIAFDPNDVISYNQGLFALALMAAKEMGLKITSAPTRAIENYQQLFNSQKGFYPISEKKNETFGPDPLVPDLISQIYFDKPLLNNSTVKLHYNNMVEYNKTRYGFKNICMSDGSYLPKEMYDIPGYSSRASKGEEGTYVQGGSWFLYDNLFLIDSYLHGIKEAEDELIRRVSMEFENGGTTFECINTKNGEMWKPNMGWNIAIYAIWHKLIKEGKADDKLFKGIDSIVKFKPVTQ
jgi:hypothetical protein